MENTTPILCPLYPSEITPCDPDEVAPLVAHLEADGAIDDPAMTFPRGTLLPDGRLDLCKQSLGPDNCRWIVEALGKNTRVRSLLLGTDGIGDRGARDVAQLAGANPRVEILYLGCNRIGPDGAAALAASLERNASVRGLWLKRNPIGVEGARAIAAMLENNTTLTTLDLVNTGIGPEGVAAILDALIARNRSVARLYLGGNAIGPETAPRLAELLRAAPQLHALLLNVNRLGNEGAAILAEGLHDNVTLRELGLASNGIGPAGGMALLDVALRHPALETLDLGYSKSTRALGESANTLGDDGAHHVASLLPGNGPLRRLDLRRNGIGAGGIAALTAALERNATLQQLFVDGRSDLHRPGIPTPPDDIALIRSVYR